MAGISSGKKRIAILGGGISALTAAFELTQQDPDGSAFDLTVYTLGWRLGGKAAVGRDASRYDRAYEHGLHIWAGFYDNAFDVVRRLYKQLGKDEDAWKSCFTPLNHFTVMETDGAAWKPWLLEIPPNDLEPGLGPALPFAPWALFVQFLGTLESAFVQSKLPAYLGPESHARAAARLATIAPLGRRPGEGETVLTVTRQAAERLPSHHLDVGDEHRHALTQLISACQEQVEDAIAASSSGDDQRRLAVFYDLAFAMAKGLLSDKLFFEGFEAIDDVEFSQWMSENGCKPETLQSAVLRGCYDYAFASRKPGIGAGTATLLALRFALTYKGSVLHALTEPMGDCIIAPFYQYLRSRNVKFEFFCRVKKLELSPKEPIVERVILAQQVRLNKDAAYDPLIKRTDGGWSWPSAPLPNQIVNGAALKGHDLESAWTAWKDAIPERVLHRRTSGCRADDKDVFDIVILALGFEGLKTICATFGGRFPETWGNFLNNIKTTQTVALQLWLTPSTDALGWPDPETALTGFERPGDEWSAAPLTSWEDNTRLLGLERARTDQPRSLAYFCGVFPDAGRIPEPGPNPGFPDRELQRAKVAVLNWMNNRVGALWPDAVSGMPPRFRWSLPEAPSHVPRSKQQDVQYLLDGQYLRVNIDPSERYVLSVPGSVKHRLWPDRSGIGNLYLAGDWVRSGVNAGCIEAAVIAGRMTARAITEADMQITGDGSSSLFPLPIEGLPVVRTVDKLMSIAAGGVGTVDAYCATIPAPIDFVQKKLPTGLQLVPLQNWKNSHPIVLVFSRQRNVRPGILPFGGLNYHEFLELIPNVVRSNNFAPSGGPFTYMPYLLLDQPLAVAVGLNLYGFNKRLARISSEDGAFVVRSDLCEIRTNFRGTDLPGTIDKVSSISSCREFLVQPFIAQKSTGEWVYSYLDYRLENATFQRIQGQIEIGEPFLQDEGIRSNQTYEAAHYKAESIVWFHFSSHWRLSVPFTSGQLSDTSAPAQIRNRVSQLKSGLRRLYKT